MQNDFTTPLAKARGTGSAHSGSHHWIVQRITAIALIPLGLWFLSCCLDFQTMAYENILRWIAEPLHFAGFLAFLIASLYHAYLGMQTVLEDYIHHTCAKNSSIILLKLTGSGLFILGFSFLIKIAFMGR